MKEWIDGVGRTVSVPDSPQRIISLCPSITETLFALGLDRQLVGRTRYCIHPKGKVEQARIIGGTKEINFDLIQQLHPDLIVTDKEETPKEIADILMASYPLYVFDVQDYPGAIQMIKTLGEITGRGEEAGEIANEIERRFPLLGTQKPASVAYLIWRKPFMAAGRNTFITAMLEKSGFENVFKEREERYPTVTMEEIRGINPDFIFLSSEPFPFAEEHKKELQAQLPGANIQLVDGEYFSWYGVRMADAGRYFEQLKSLKSRSAL